MARAEGMFREHHLFVKSRLHAELSPYTKGKPYSEFDDLEQKVWQAVAARIEKYEDRGFPLAWLKVIVHGVVNDNFKSVWRQKRGADKTVPLDGDPPSEPLPIKATRPAGHSPDEDEDDPATVAFEAGVGRAQK